jgi:hypothetical protein
LRVFIKRYQGCKGAQLTNPRVDRIVPGQESYKISFVLSPPCDADPSSGALLRSQILEFRVYVGRATNQNSYYITPLEVVL